ncbi:MAG: hypothetical protein ACPGUV_00805 [Polyangiales bacterium]
MCKPWQILALCATLSMATTASAEATTARPARKNVIGLKPSHTLHLLHDREPGSSAELRHQEHLGGFILSYERMLWAERLALEFSKPFYFNDERIDSPFDLVFKAIWRRGRIETFAGVGVSLNVRIFAAEREEKEGKGLEFSAGPAALVGAAYLLSERWALELELGYAYVPGSDIVAHEISEALGVSYFF